MKYIFVALIFPILSFSQVKISTKKIIPLIESRQVFVNSATKLNGKTRVDIKIDLPLNTVEWYYTFTTTPSQTRNNLDLLGQLTRLYDSSGMLANSLNALSVPEGSAPIDVFLINSKGRENFYKKSFGSYEYTDPGSYEEGTVKNTRQAKVRIDDFTTGTFYLGIRNPSMNTGVNVVIEVVAIVEQTEYDNSKWSKEIKNDLYISINRGMVELLKDYNSEIIEEFTICLIEKITKQHSPNSYNELADYEKKSFFKILVKDCNSNNVIKFE